MAGKSYEEVSRMRGQNVYSRTGDNIGRVKDFYYDEESRTPEWLGIDSEIFDNKHLLVPVDAVLQQGNDRRLPYDRDKIQNAPAIDADFLSRQDAGRLHAYYESPGPSTQTGMSGLGAGQQPQPPGMQPAGQPAEGGADPPTAEPRAMGPQAFQQPTSERQAATGQPATSQHPMTQEATQQAIEKKAYELYERRGREPGHEVEDWAEAEKQVAETGTPEESSRTGFGTESGQQLRRTEGVPGQVEDSSDSLQE
jgi:sporulation protein YlmC with PRC-barrel domain